jgi:protein SCO1/2
MSRSTTVVVVLLAVSAARAGPEDSSRALPSELREVKFEPVLKEQVPPSLRFRDEQGKTVRLGDYFDGKRPVILVLVQYRCPMLCNLVLNGLTESLRELAGKQGFRVGEQFRVLTVSFDERETPELATAKKAAQVEAYGFSGAAEGWHFLTGEKEEITALADKCGFTVRYDAKKDQFAHPSGILLLTPEGRISRYFFGIQYQTRDLYYGLVEASQFRIGSPIKDRVVLLFCYSYDPVRGTYQFAVMNVVRLAGVLTVLGLGTFVVVMFRRERHRVACGLASTAKPQAAEEPVEVRP